MKTTSLKIAVIVLTTFLAEAQNTTSPSFSPTFPPSTTENASLFKDLIYAFAGAFIVCTLVEAYRLASRQSLHPSYNEDQRAMLLSCYGSPQTSPAHKITYYLLVWLHFFFLSLNSIISYPWTRVLGPTLYHDAEQPLEQNKAENCCINGYVFCLVTSMLPPAISLLLSGILVAAYPVSVFVACAFLAELDITKNTWGNYAVGAITFIAGLYAIPFTAIYMTESNEQNTALLPEQNVNNFWQKSRTTWKQAKIQADQYIKHQGGLPSILPQMN